MHIKIDWRSAAIGIACGVAGSVALALVPADHAHAAALPSAGRHVESNVGDVGSIGIAGWR